jgi:hypothetical protein
VEPPPPPHPTAHDTTSASSAPPAADAPPPSCLPPSEEHGAASFYPSAASSVLPNLKVVFLSSDRRCRLYWLTEQAWDLSMEHAWSMTASGHEQGGGCGAEALGPVERDSASGGAQGRGPSQVGKPLLPAEVGAWPAVGLAGDRPARCRNTVDFCERVGKNHFVFQ